MRKIGLIIASGMILFSSIAYSHELQLTIYDDGRSCPGNCDAHAVLNNTQNGTTHAHLPGTQANPKKCIKGKECEICFGHDTASCMIVLYRGSGPPAGKVDFTPAFYQQFCEQPDIPEALKKQCTILDKAVADRGYDKRLNCIGGNTSDACTKLIEKAQAAYDSDLKNYDQCIEMGEAAFNAAQSSDNTRRIYGCAYSKLKTGGPNSNGKRWHQLLPAACRPGTFVGRDGLDCCGGQPRVEAALHPECTPYYLQQ